MEYTHTDLKLVGVHVPDETSGPFDNPQQAQAAGYDTLEPTTGTYQIGVEIDGAFIPLLSEKASLIFDRIEATKLAAATGSSKAGAGKGKAAATGSKPAGDTSQG